MVNDIWPTLFWDWIQDPEVFLYVSSQEPSFSVQLFLCLGIGFVEILFNNFPEFFVFRIFFEKRLSSSLEEKYKERKLT